VLSKNLVNEEALAHWGLLAKNKNQRSDVDVNIQ
jgi:hypothetical protein